MKKYIILAISLLFAFPTSAFALTKKSNYQDFTSWYLEETGYETVPFVSSALFPLDQLFSPPYNILFGGK